MKSPTLPPLSPDGDTIPDIYRKQAMRLEELEKENKRLNKEARDAEMRWRKTEEELEEAREVNSEIVELRAKLDKAGDVEAELTELVCYATCQTHTPRNTYQLMTDTEEQSGISNTPKSTAPISGPQTLTTRVLT